MPFLHPELNPLRLFMVLVITLRKVWKITWIIVYVFAYTMSQLYFKPELTVTHGYVTTINRTS